MKHFAVSALSFVLAVTSIACIYGYGDQTHKFDMWTYLENITTITESFIGLDDFSGVWIGGDLEGTHYSLKIPTKYYDNLGYDYPSGSHVYDGYVYFNSTIRLNSSFVDLLLSTEVTKAILGVVINIEMFFSRINYCANFIFADIAGIFRWIPNLLPWNATVEVANG